MSYFFARSSVKQMGPSRLTSSAKSSSSNSSGITFQPRGRINLLVQKTYDNLRYLFHRDIPLPHQPAERINVSTLGEEALRDLFLCSLSDDEAINNLSNRSSVLANLGLFFEKLQEHRHRIDQEVGERAVLQLLRLHTVDARNQYCSWKQLKDLLQSRTLLTFPIDRLTIAEYNEYSDRLRTQGIVEGQTQTLTQIQAQGHQQLYPLATAGVSSHSQMASLLLDEHDRLRHATPAPVDATAPELQPVPMVVEVEVEEVVADDATAKTALFAMRFTDLTQDDQRGVDDVVLGPNNEEVLVDKFCTPMTRIKMVCLRPHTWLNDEVINFYMCMLKERDDALCLAHPPRRPSWFFNSFFIDKLLIADKKYTYANVKRWSKKFDVFAMEKIFMPVNLGNTHWTLLVVYIQRKEIHYYDSMSGPGKKYIEGVLRWLQDEAKDKKGTDNYDTSDWATFDREPFVPQQQNGVDCGVFTTVCADFVSDDLELMYSQGDMPFFREKICADILRGSLLYAV